jgi:hypothetical protein
VILLMAMKRPATLAFPGTLIFIGVSFGAMNLMRIAGNPRLEAIRAVDELQSIGVGVCFGMAVLGIIIILREIVLRKRQ